MIHAAIGLRASLREPARQLVHFIRKR